jgi:hypothetical protein
MDNPIIILTVLVLLVGLFATAGYGLMSVAQHRGARVAFCTAAFLFAAIGIELGLVMTWPLSVQIVVAGLFAFAAAGTLVYVLNSVSVLQNASKKPDAYIIADCYRSQYPNERPVNGDIYALIKDVPPPATPSIEIAAVPWAQSQQSAFSNIYRCDLSIKGDLPIFNVTLTFRFEIKEAHFEGGGISSGNILGTKEMAVFIRKLDIYPMSPYSIYIEDRSGFWVSIIPIQAFSKSGPRDAAIFIEVRPTTTTELGPIPKMPQQ